MANTYNMTSYFNYILNMLFFLLILLFLLNMKNHPVSIMIIILLYSSLICLNMSMWKMNYILSIFLFLMMISGLLIIFLYFSSLISNEQSKINPNLLLFMLITYMINSISFLWLSNYKYYYYSHHTYSMTSSNLSMFIYKYKFHESATIYQSNKSTFNNILNLYEYPMNNLTILSMFYLLFSLFIIIKICSSKFSSLRKIK